MQFFYIWETVLRSTLYTHIYKDLGKLRWKVKEEQCVFICIFAVAGLLSCYLLEMRQFLICFCLLWFLIALTGDTRCSLRQYNLWLWLCEAVILQTLFSFKHSHMKPYWSNRQSLRWMNELWITFISVLNLSLRYDKPLFISAYCGDGNISLSE